MFRGVLQVLIIDHYDSYTNNILQLLPTEPEIDTEDAALWHPTIIRYDEYQWEEFSEKVLPQFDAVILSPGPGRPDRDTDFGFNSRLIKDATVPILGICLGHQGIGTSLGAKIQHASHIKHGQVSYIQHDGSGLFEGLPQTFEGVQYNSLVLDINTLPDELLCSAWIPNESDPGSKICMGVSHRSKPLYGVQWHPESICSSKGLEILRNFHRLVQNFWSSASPRSRCFAARDRQPSLSLCCRNKQPAVQNPLSKSIASSGVPGKAYAIKQVQIKSGALPELVFEHLIKAKSTDGEAWLDSAKSRDEHSRYSYLAKGIFSLAYSTQANTVDVYHCNKHANSFAEVSTFWKWFNDFQGLVQHSVDSLEDNSSKATLQIGFIGYFGYEMKRESLPGYARPVDRRSVGQTADAQFLFAQEVLRFDHFTKNWTFYGLARHSAVDPIAEYLKLPGVGLTGEQFRRSVESLTQGMNTLMPSESPSPALPRFSCSHDQQSYVDLIQKAKYEIQEGESYEMTLTTKFRAELNNDHYQLYRTLRKKNPAPYSAFLNFPATNTTILSSSPERFISISQKGIAEMKPIKGTVAVSKDPEQDKRIKQCLASDVKELAENLMIVDLIRNDLHNVASPSTITVPKLMQVESYETVHQLVTTIQARVNPSVGAVSAIRSIFPPGSMTGAPKLRSVQILERLEGAQDRGIYSGCLGYVCASGAVDQSVVIRTIVRQENNLELGAGGAITWLSDPEKEWQEALTKANAVAEIILPHDRADSMEPAHDT